jgi:hypothetical protein
MISDKELFTWLIIVIVSLGLYFLLIGGIL